MDFIIEVLNKFSELVIWWYLKYNMQMLKYCEQEKMIPIIKYLK